MSHHVPSLPAAARVLASVFLLFSTGLQHAAAQTTDARADAAARAALALAAAASAAPATKPAAGADDCPDCVTVGGKTFHLGIPKVPPVAGAPLTYADAYRQALRENKPLIVWVGGSICPRCVAETADEFVHVYADSFADAAPPSLVVSAPDGEGSLARVATISWWIEGDATYGHTSSARRLLHRWLASNRRAGQVFQIGPPATGYRGAGMMTPTLAPRAAPARSFLPLRRSGGCSS